MTTRGWSFVLQWSRVGVSAALFLVAVRFLSLVEIGVFATAFAPIRMTQGLHKAGIAESVIVFGKNPTRRDALFALSVGLGIILSLGLGLIGLALNSPILIALAAIPFLNGLGAVSDGLLRQALRLRALALRTACVQGVAAALAFWLLYRGWGPMALAVFAIANAGLTCAVSIYLARWHPGSWPGLQSLRLLLPKAGQIAGRDLLSTALIPLVQLLVALGLGLSAAGAFQIATRVLGLIDALTLSPLRFIALPQFRVSLGPEFRADLAEHNRLSALLSAWVWGGILAAAPQILAIVVGPENAPAASPILRALAGFGLLSALAMPINQALTAQGHIGLMLVRAAILLSLGICLSLPALTLSATAVAMSLSLAAAVTAFWQFQRALPRLGLVWWDLIPAWRPLLAATVMIAVLFAAPQMLLVTKIVFGTTVYAACMVMFRRIPAYEAAA